MVQKNSEKSEEKSKLEATLNEVALKKALEQRLEKELRSKEIQTNIDNEISQQLPKIVEREVKKTEPKIREALNTDVKKVADESFEDMRQKLEKDRLNVIQATSIIVIFIGFLITQLNILGGDRSAKEQAGLSMVLLGSVIMFALLIDLIIHLDLPLKKVKIRTGATDAFRKAFFSNITTTREEVPLGWNPNTWGEGLKIRGIAALVGLVIFVLGVGLITI